MIERIAHAGRYRGLRIAPLRKALALGVLFASGVAVGAAVPHRVNVAGLGDLATEISGSGGSGITAFSPAGDVDGDGLEDLLIRFAHAEVVPPVAYDHVVLLYGFATPGGPLDVLGPSVRNTVIRTYDTSPTADPNFPINPTGVAGGRDVNGDGVPDLLIASTFERAVDGEAVLLILGGQLPERIDGSMIGDTVPGAFISFVGPPFGEALGAHVGLSGDLNGDGLAEIFVWSKAELGASRLYVLFGQTDPPRVINAAQAGDEVPGFVLAVSTDAILTHVGALGDVDGDGFSDLSLAVARSVDDDQLLLLGREIWPPFIRSDDAPETIGRVFRGFKGLETAGDVDGDGRQDVIVTHVDPAPFGPGRAFLMDGRDLGRLPRVVELGTLGEVPPRASFSVPYEFGVKGSRGPTLTTTPGRDVDGDGKSEILLGSPNHDVREGLAASAVAGAAYLVAGGSDVTGDMAAAEAAQRHGVQIDGLEVEGSLGTRAWILGDVTGDGLGEVLLASRKDYCLTPGSGQFAWRLWLVSGAVLRREQPVQLAWLYPVRGALAGGDRVLLLGTGFGDSPRVYFGAGEAASVETVASGILVATSPPSDLARRVEVRVEARGSSTAALDFQYERLKTVRLDREPDRVLRVLPGASWNLTLRGAVALDFDGDGSTDAAFLGSGQEPGHFGELRVVLGRGTREESVGLDGLEPPRGMVAKFSGRIVGTGLAAGGDLDSDRRDDLLVRWSLTNQDTGEFRYEWLILFGRDGFPEGVPLEALDGTTRLLHSTGTLDAGAAAIVDDVTGDGVDDLLLSGWIPGGTGGSFLYIVKGWTARPEPSLDLATLAEEGRGARLFIDLMVDRVAGALGDFNGDGTPDWYFGGGGALQEGTLVIGYGGTPIFTGQTFDLTRGFFGDNGGLLVAGASFLSGAFSSAAAVDLDGDGDREVFQYIDDPESCGLEPRAGGGFLFDYGAALRGTPPGEFPPLIAGIYGAKLTGRPDLVPSGPGSQEGVIFLENSFALEGLGRTASPAGDFDGDGFEDLLLGAPGVYTLEPVAGSAVIIRGGPQVGESPTMELPGADDRAIRMVADDGIGLGMFVAGGFDWDRDGTSDVLVASRDHRAYVVFGEGREAEFLRGDGDGDGSLAITDAVVVLMYLFAGGLSLPCLDAADSNDDGVVNISDPIHLLGYLFLGGAAPPAPFPGAGLDPTGDDMRCLR